jgi:nucleotide-binding universal stress UspA family protein
MKLAWAFNPFDGNRKLERTGLALLKGLHRGASAVEIVYVAWPGEPQLSTAFEVPLEQRYSRYPTRLIKTAMRRLDLARVRVTVLSQRSSRLTACVRTLADHLARGGADLTLLASHARKGIPRLLLGSFAETLVHLAKTDLLVFNEGSRVARSPKTLLFAHDLSLADDRGLQAAITYARAWGCVLHVVHVPDPAYGFTFSGRAAEVEAYRRRIRKQVDRIGATVQRAGVDGSVVIHPRWHPVAERILQHRESVRADMLLVVAKSGRVAGLMGGSVTRKLLRSAPVPMLVIKR